MVIRALTVAVGLTWFLGAACGSSSSLTVVALDETEPNDDVATAQSVGHVAPGQKWVVQGEVDAALDPQDGFEFTVDAPCQTLLTLTFDDPGADLALALVDVPSGLEVLEFQTSDNPELGEVIFTGPFAFPTPFQLVVSAVSGSSSYTFEILVQESPFPALAPLAPLAEAPAPAPPIRALVVELDPAGNPVGLAPAALFRTED